MTTESGIQTNQILSRRWPLHKMMRSKRVVLKPKSIKHAILIRYPLTSPDPIDVPYVEAGAVSKIWLNNGEVMWVTSSPEELKDLSEWPP